jgi:hypothetical protein
MLEFTWHDWSAFSSPWYHSAALIEKLVHGDTMPLYSELCTLALAVFGFGIGVLTGGTFPASGGPADSNALGDIQLSMRLPPHAT